jgi:hypothetical protein
MANLARVVHLPRLPVERLVQSHGSLRRGEVDETVAHIALVAALSKDFELNRAKTASCCRVRIETVESMYMKLVF